MKFPNYYTDYFSFVKNGGKNDILYASIRTFIVYDKYCLL